MKFLELHSYSFSHCSQLHKSLHTSLSYESSSCFSASEYFDAADALSDDEGGGTDTSSEASSDNSSFTSEASDAGTDAHPSGKSRVAFQSQ